MNGGLFLACGSGRESERQASRCKAETAVLGSEPHLAQAGSGVMGWRENRDCR